MLKATHILLSVTMGHICYMWACVLCGVFDYRLLSMKTQWKNNKKTHYYESHIIVPLHQLLWTALVN